MKIIITERQKDLLFENKRNELLIDMIKYEGWESAAEMVGGIENLKKVANIHTPMDFLNIFNDLDIVQSEEKPNWTLFRYEKGNNMMIYDREKNIFYMNFYSIWLFLEDGFEFEYKELREITEHWLSETYDLKGITLNPEVINIQFRLSETYDLKGITFSMLISDEMTNVV